MMIAFVLMPIFNNVNIMYYEHSTVNKDIFLFYFLTDNLNIVRVKNHVTLSIIKKNIFKEKKNVYMNIAFEKIKDLVYTNSEK